ncbi:LysR family transcriptional regulator [Variovorax sp. KK3]|uniref:LysR family transcriptional regulator n=1 Tax=Variovorax sp. KK3 TaxID=1855728 RepID=UPI00097BE6AD|nr:LysR family transcriptional regulator [Variovorax sp. KK3]
MPARLNITLRQMRAFVEAYRLRNLTHAADALHVTQSAMSALIRQFEEELGVRLFERTPRVLRPNRAADDAFRQVESILESIAALGEDMRDRAEQVERVLAFSCAPALSSAVIPTVLAAFKRENPDVKTVMYDAGDASLIQRVLTEDVEFSIGFFEHEPEAVSREALVIDHLCAVCSKDSPLAAMERVTWHDLMEQPIINLSKGLQVQQLVSEAMANAGRAYRPAYEISFIHTALALAAQGFGIVVIPGYLVRGNPHTTSLVAKKLHDPDIERSLLVHTRQGHVLSAPAETFLQMLRDHLAQLV